MKQTWPRGEVMAEGFMGSDSQVLATILDPFQASFDDLDIGTDETSEPSTFVNGKIDTSAISTLCLRRRQVSATEARQVFAVETKQMYNLKARQTHVTTNETMKFL